MQQIIIIIIITLLDLRHLSVPLGDNPIFISTSGTKQLKWIKKNITIDEDKKKKIEKINEDTIEIQNLFRY